MSSRHVWSEEMLADLCGKAVQEGRGKELTEFLEVLRDTMRGVPRRRDQLERVDNALNFLRKAQEEHA